MHIPIFAHVASASYLIPLGTVIRYWKTLRFPMKLFAVFSIYSAIDVITEFVLGRMGIPNHFLLNIYTVLEVECILFLYSKWTQKKNFQDALKILGMMYFTFWSLDVSFLPFPKTFSENLDTIANSIMLITSIFILSQLIKRSEGSITDYSIFWIAIGVLLYSAGTIVIFSVSNTILNMGIDYFNILWHINWGFIIITNLLFARSFLCKTF